MGDPTNIKNLDDLLRDSVSAGGEIVDVHMERLTAPGENFGSIMMKIDITVKNTETGREEVVQGVAKLIPPDPHIQKIFSTQVTYKSEVGFYSSIVPTLMAFQKEKGVEGLECFAKFLGGRTNLNGSDVVDNDAVLVLENLRIAGYSTAERGKGYDLKMAKLILKDLAELHGTALALKLQRPEVFNEKIRPYLSNFQPLTENTSHFNDMVKKILSENVECRKLISKLTPWGANQIYRKRREPFATVIHQDLWVNNMMQKYEDGVPLSNKFVDFQIVDYGSPAADVFFFLFTNLQLGVLKDHLDFLLRYYHQYLIKTLEDHQCDTEAFQFESFMEELIAEVEYELPHVLMFSTFVVFLGKTPDKRDATATIEDIFWPLVDEANKERARYIALECERRGWLKLYCS